MKKIFLILLSFINLAGSNNLISKQEIQARTRAILNRKYGFYETLTDRRTSAICCLLANGLELSLLPRAITESSCCFCANAALVCAVTAHHFFETIIGFGEERQSCLNFCCPNIEERVEAELEYLRNRNESEKAAKERIE